MCGKMPEQNGPPPTWHIFFDRVEIMVDMTKFPDTHAAIDEAYRQLAEMAKRHDHDLGKPLIMSPDELN